MRCKEAEKLIENKIAGLLTSEQVILLDRHLAECEDCRCVYEELMKLEKVLKGVIVDVEPPADFVAGVMANLKVEKAPRRTYIGGYIKRYAFSFGAAAAAVALAFGIWTQPFVQVANNPDNDPDSGFVTPDSSDIENNGSSDDKEVVTDSDAAADNNNSDIDKGDSEAVSSGKNTGSDTGSKAPGQGDQPAGTKDSTTGSDRVVGDEDLGNFTRLDGVFEVASGTAKPISSSLKLSDVYVDYKVDAIAPSFKNGKLYFFARPREESSYYLVTPNANMASGLEFITNSENDLRSIQRSINNVVDKGSLTEKDGILYNGDLCLLPSAMKGANIDYGIAPNGNTVAVNIESSNEDAAGLWITDLKATKLIRISAKGAGKIISFAPDSTKVVFTDDQGKYYLADMSTLKTYLVTSYDDDRGEIIIAWADDSESFYLDFAKDAGFNRAIYEVKIP